MDNFMNMCEGEQGSPLFDYVGSGTINLFGSSLCEWYNYSYVCSGTINLFGCSSYRKKTNVYYKWAEGCILYSKEKAKRGGLEEVYIKMVLLNRSYNQIVPIYKDSYNSLWNECDLVDEVDAINLIQEYIDTERQNVFKYLDKC